MFYRIFANEMAAAFGVLLYVTCPYRIYLCYDIAHLGRIVTWALLPLVIYGIVGLYQSGSRLPAPDMAAAAVAFAGIGYTDSIMVPILAALIGLSCVCQRKITGMIPLAAGGILCLPGIIPLFRYLLFGGMEELNIPLSNINLKGYAIGQLFTSFTYKEGMPGFGLGLLGAIILFLWIHFTEEDHKVSKHLRFYCVTAALLICVSLCYFPWDVVQRIGTPLLRYISLFGSPGIFFGLSSIFICIPGTYAIQHIRQHKQAFVKTGFPLMIAAASIAVSVYLCNMLTYTRLPIRF
jgi:hypothetical protein